MVTKYVRKKCGYKGRAQMKLNRQKSSEKRKIQAIPLNDFLEKNAQKTANFKKYIPSKSICEATDKDVLLGRGSRSRYHGEANQLKNLFLTEENVFFFCLG